MDSHDPGTDEHALSKDVIFTLLRVERRRLTLWHLRNEGSGVSLSFLASHIAAFENGVPVGAITSAQRKRVYISLYQSHLPKLDDADVIDFDPRQGAVALAKNAPLLYPYLDLDLDQEVGVERENRRIRSVLSEVSARLPHAARAGGTDTEPSRT